MRLSLFTFALVGAALPAAEVTTLKGEKFSGDIVFINEREITLRTVEREVVLPLQEIMTVQGPGTASTSRPKVFVDIELVDGTLIHAAAATIKGKKVMVLLPDGQEIAVELSKIAYILNQAQDPVVRKAFDTVAAERIRSDRFLIRRDNRLDGLEGTFGDATADGKSITFTTKDGESRNLPLDRLTALVFNNRLEGNIPSAVCRLLDVAGNRFHVQKISWKNGKVNITTVAGLSVEFASPDKIALLDFSKDKIVYLSELKPVAEDRGFDELPVVVARDANLDSQPIQLDGQTYSRGLTLHAPIALTYDLNAEYREFRAVVGVDSSVQTPSHVRLIIEGDGRPLFQTEVKVKDRSKPINLDIRKVRQLTIRAVQVEGLPFGQQLTLADARITK